MKEEIHRIIKIDQCTNENERETEEKILAMKEELREKITSLEKEIMEKGKEEGQEAYDTIMASKDREVEKREALRNEKIKKIDNLYRSKKGELIDLAFSRWIYQKRDRE
ncbi:MAG: hypothetical protein Q4Q07_08275 [Tissierellia bacterium]|nr:hypothetical protein [Tissierellia bacterium]